ncbi:MAG: hypothetical protein IJZ55_05730 [Lachnospiraceae bacterium]|nr:hypothetical protein [Lachnospiraceae bacterium]
MSASVVYLPILVLFVLALCVLGYFICYRIMINRKLKQQESEAHVPMASTESVFKIVVIIGVLVIYSSLNSKLVDLRSELRDTKSALSDKIYALQYELYEMKEAAKKEASLISGAYYEFGELDAKEHTAELQFFVTPKSYSEGTEVSVVFRGETIPLTHERGGRFTGSTIVSIFEDVYEKCVITVTEDGVTKTEVWENAPQGRLCFNCLPVLAVGGGGGSQMSKNSLRVEYEYELFPEYADSFRNLTLYVKKGGTTVEEFQFVDGHISINQSYSVKKGEKGETIEFYLRGVDEYGFIHEKLEGTWNVGETIGNEAHSTMDNYDYQIYAPDGTLLTK